MQFELVYDIAAMSEAPRSALTLGLAAALGAAVWVSILRMRGLPLGGGVKFLIFVVLILFALSYGLRYEQRRLVARTDVLTVAGPVAGHWTKRVRRDSSNRWYWEWEGFYVQGVAFAYARNVEQNYFHNAGSRSFELRDGMHIRLQYIEERSGGEVRNHILRVERELYQSRVGS
ncbi:MAG: hypothetical protein ACRD8O_01675 [Bryobacteraceae bacterium]